MTQSVLSVDLGDRLRTCKTEPPDSQDGQKHEQDIHLIFKSLKFGVLFVTMLLVSHFGSDRQGTYLLSASIS